MGSGILTSAAAVGGERWWIGVGGGGDPQPDPAGGLSRSEPEARPARCDPFGLAGVVGLRACCVCFQNASILKYRLVYKFWYIFA